MLSEQKKREFADHGRHIVEVLREKGFSDAEGYASPFIPGIGSDYGRDGHPRVMICGKATYGWEKDKKNSWDADVLSDWSSGSLPDGFGSAFWSFAKQVAAAAIGEEVNEATLASIVWTNIAKIGSAKGNLPDREMKEHATLFAELFLEELTIFEPDILVIVAGWYGCSSYIPAITSYLSGKTVGEYDDEDYKTYFEKRDAGGLKAVSRPNAKKLSVWITRHPQGWAMDKRNAVVTAIAKDA